MFEPPVPTPRDEAVWLQPYPDALLEGAVDVPIGSEARYEQIEVISLAFVTALQVLPPRQLPAPAAAGHRPPKAARCRLTCRGRDRGQVRPRVGVGKLDTLVALLTDDVFIAMPPMPVGYEGRDVVIRFCASLFAAGRGFDLVPARANGQPAFGAYLRAPASIARRRTRTRRSAERPPSRRS